MDESVKYSSVGWEWVFSYHHIIYYPTYCHHLNPSPYPVLTPSIPAALSLKTISEGVFKSLKISNVFDFLHQAKDFSWLPCLLPPQCRFIMSTVSSSLSYKSLCARPDVRTVELLNVGDEEVKLNIFRQYLFIPNKDPLRQSKPTLRKKTNLNPLKLTILANELRECRIYRDEYQCLKEYLEVASIQELWELILKRWIEDYSWTFIPKRANSDTVASGEGRPWPVLTTSWSPRGERSMVDHPVEEGLRMRLSEKIQDAQLNCNFR